MTSVAKLPEGGVMSGADPFSDRPSPWPKLILTAVVIGFVVSFSNSQGWVYALTKPGTPFHDATDFALGDRKLSAEEQAAKEAAEKAAEDAAEAKPGDAGT